MEKIYVTATDKLMSGWGLAENKISKVVCVCDGKVEAFRVMDNLKRQNGMKYINYSYNEPRYSSRRYVVSFYNRDNAPLWFN